MSDYEIKATVLGFHPEHGELIAASEAKEAIAHFNDIAKAQLAKANERLAVLETYFLEATEISFDDVKRTHSDELNKFAIETSDKALQSLLNKKCPVSGYVIRDKESREIIAEELELIRKEQE
ncbi:hypothetical protein DBR45_34655 [Pseudomonas sp. HMWF031]|nr:hypothetical protein DBR45_34655 [Pseudomonas sp. HMWF031]